MVIGLFKILDPLLINIKVWERVGVCVTKVIGNDPKPLYTKIVGAQPLNVPRVYWTINLSFLAILRGMLLVVKIWTGDMPEFIYVVRVKLAVYWAIGTGFKIHKAERSYIFPLIS